jgi:hypothetical protein
MDDRLIIEAAPGGKNSDHYKELAGKWMDSRTPPNAAKSAASGLTPRGEIGSRKFIFSSTGQESATETGIARFSPKFDGAGHYYVYATWPRGGNATPVNFVIHHATGETAKAFAQDGYGVNPTGSGADAWVALGDYDFQPGDEQYVEIQLRPGALPAQSRVSGQVYADAICFSKTPLPDARSVAQVSTVNGGETEANSNASPGAAQAKPAEIAGPLGGKAL